MPGKGNYTIWDSSPTVILRPALNRSMFIMNTGDETVYLAATQADCTSLTGMPLSSGATKQWIAGDECYAIAGSGTTGTINVSDNPGGVTDPAAIGRAIYVSGIPPVDERVLIFSQSLYSSTTPYTSSVIDTTTYASINLVFQPAFGNVPLPGIININWYSSENNAVSGTPVLIGTDQFGMGNGAENTWLTLPVRGARMTVDFTLTGGGLAFDIYGSYTTVSRPRYSTPSSGALAGTVAGSALSGMTTWVHTIPFGGNSRWYPEVVAGPAKLYVRFSSTATWDITLRILTTSFPGQSIFPVSVQNLAVTASTAQLEYDLILPPLPLEFVMVNSAAAGNGTFRAVMIYGNPYA